MIVTIMKRKLGFLLIFLGIITLVVFIVRFFLASRTPKAGVLKIHSTPAASVFMDNKHVGRTPYDAEVPQGEYTIKLIPESAIDDVAVWQGKIRVAANLLTYINRDLAPTELASAGEVLWLEKITSNNAEMTIATVPDSAMILLDEQEQGVAPLTMTNISAGDHSLTVTSPGFLSRTLKIRATAGYKLNAAIQLALSPLDAPVRSEESSSSASPSGQLLPDSGIESENSGTEEEPPRPYARITDTPTGFLRVREKPTTTAAEIGRVEPGDAYSILTTEEGWYEIQMDDEETGWISSQYAQYVD